MCLKQITSWIKTYALKEVDKDDDEKMSLSLIKSVLKKEFGSSCKIYMSDEYYLKESKKALAEFLVKDFTDKYIYTKEITDCDDFSFRLMGNASFGDLEGTAFGILWAKVPNGSHAVNCFVDNNLEVWIIEPQSDSIFPLPEDWEPYLVIM